MFLDPDGNTCESCGGRPDICFLPMPDDYGDVIRAVILCRSCIHPVELSELERIVELVGYVPRHTIDDYGPEIDQPLTVDDIPF